MPNWAYTSYAIEGPKEDLQKIEQAILHPEVKEGSDESWEGNVLNTLGSKWIGRDKDKENGLYMRGFIDGDPWWVNDALRFCAQEAWNITDFHIALRDLFPDCNIFWTTEESGMALYGTNDAEGKYFPNRFYVDACICGEYLSEYFQSEEAAYKWLSEHTSGQVTNKKQVEIFNTECREDDFIEVHEYEIFN
jgi:hypothetical protein